MPRHRPFLRVVFALLAMAAAAAAQVPSALQVSARHGESVRGTLDGIHVLVLRGTHAQRGLAHGVLAGKEILGLLNEVLIPAIEERRPGGWEKHFVAGTKMFRWAPRFEEELAALLEGIKKAVPDAKDRRLTLPDREISIDDLKAINCFSDIMGAGCSSFSVWGPLTADGQAITGRNLDYAAFPITRHVGLIAVVPAEKGLRATLEPTMAGSIGLGTGLNSEGVFLALHDERGLPTERKDVVPRSLALRQALEGAAAGSAVEDIAAVLRKNPTRLGNNIHVSFPLAAAAAPAVLEWDGNTKDGGVTVRRANAGVCDCCLVCTNHFVARAAHGGGDSKNRYTQLLDAAVKARAENRKIDVEAVKEMLESVSRNGGHVTHLSMVVLPAQRRFVVAFSPRTGSAATNGKWTTIEWKQIFGE
jgi:hypothetical protein